MDDADFLEEVIAYIEKSEELMDDNYATSRNVKQLIQDKEMPDIYDEAVRRLEAISPGRQRHHYLLWDFYTAK